MFFFNGFPLLAEATTEGGCSADSVEKTTEWKHFCQTDALMETEAQTSNHRN